MKKLTTKEIYFLSDMLSKQMLFLNEEEYLYQIINNTKNINPRDASVLWDLYWRLDKNVQANNDTEKWMHLFNAARKKVSGLVSKVETLHWLVSMLKGSGWSVSRVIKEHPKLKDKYRRLILAGNNQKHLNRISIPAMIELAAIMDYKLSNPYLVEYQASIKIS